MSLPKKSRLALQNGPTYFYPAKKKKTSTRDLSTIMGLSPNVTYRSSFLWTLEADGTPETFSPEHTTGPNFQTHHHDCGPESQCDGVRFEFVYISLH